MVSRCVLWQCESLVQLKGVVLGNPQAMILEWMPYGPLDVYLHQNSLHVKTPELIEAASHIAKAVWFLVRLSIFLYFYFINFYSCYMKMEL